MNIYRLVGFAGAIASCCTLLSTPAAMADAPSLPVAGTAPADVTIRDIQAMGYTVSINWATGESNRSLGECRVNNVNDTAASNGQGIVYVTVDCP